ncbi:hypothetical protein E2320_013909 [Naja naja]|nr:hypothetical protein E2320_013909 [Naja naja]
MRAGAKPALRLDSIVRVWRSFAPSSRLFSSLQGVVLNPAKSRERDEEIAFLFKDFGIKSLKKHSNSFKCFAFLDLMSPEAAKLAIQLLNGYLLKGRPMSDLELVPPSEYGFTNGATRISPVNQRASYAVPMEMRSSFLFHVLNGCFGDANWLSSVAGVATGEVGLLVTDTFPLMPYFWGMVLNEVCKRRASPSESCKSMEQLFMALAEAESSLPFLAKEEVQRGTRCLAECDIREESRAWNRCWVLGPVGDRAVVFFVDFGRCTRVFPPQDIRRQILVGKLKGPSQWEPHILKFVAKTS